jgi:hypothetical protein
LIVFRYLILGLILGVALLGQTSGLSKAWLGPRPAPGSMPSDVPFTRVQGEACTESCRRQHSNCLIRDKGSPNCNAQLQRCLQTCLAGKRK